MGGVTSEILAMMKTPGTNKAAGEYVLVFTVHPIITTYTTIESPSQTQGLGGVPANHMVLDAKSGDKAGLGDSIGTNNGWQMLYRSNNEVITKGPWAGQLVQAHVKGAPNDIVDGKHAVRVVPIRAPEYRDLGGGGTYLDVRSSNAYYSRISGQIRAGTNGLQLIMNKEDVYVIVSSGQQSVINSLCGGSIGGSCWDGEVKELTEFHLNIMLRGSGILAGTSTQSGKKIR